MLCPDARTEGATAAERQQRICIWGGISFAPLFFVGFWLLAGSCLILEFIFPQLVWQTAAYRSERSAGWSERR